MTKDHIFIDFEQFNSKIIIQRLEINLTNFCSRFQAQNLFSGNPPFNVDQIHPVSQNFGADFLEKIRTFHFGQIQSDLDMYK